mmetsp:Transcript_2487/g.9360  ORF Transcript_2487/g.9360 Transcript_2487/m.9360 type:complete len:227 (+) Transcript_2487:1-681(+)
MGVGYEGSRAARGGRVARRLGCAQRRVTNTTVFTRNQTPKTQLSSRGGLPGSLYEPGLRELPFAVVNPDRHQVRVHVAHGRQVRRLPVRHQPSRAERDAARVVLRSLAPHPARKHDHVSAIPGEPVPRVAFPLRSHVLGLCPRWVLSPLVGPAARSAQRLCVCEGFVVKLLPRAHAGDVRVVPRTDRLLNPDPAPRHVAVLLDGVDADAVLHGDGFGVVVGVGVGV